MVRTAGTGQGRGTRPQGGVRLAAGGDGVMPLRTLRLIGGSEFICRVRALV
jgi:hypothetical protein